MAQPENQYPKQVITVEKITDTSEEYRVITAVHNESEEKAVATAVAYMNAFNEANATLASGLINFPHARVGGTVSWQSVKKLRN